MSGRRDVEAKLSHLADLRDRLARTGVEVQTVAAHECPDRATSAKARRKVFDQALEGRAMTGPMRLTPRVRLEERARSGHWPAFPVSPAQGYARLGGEDGDRFVSKGGTFALTRRLHGRLARCDRAGLSVAERLALHRAFHTVGLECADHSDDSYGVVGEIRLDAFRTYVSIDWAVSGMSAEDYWQDLCELLVAEPYAPIVEAFLHTLADEWREAYQDFHAEQAEQLVAWLHIAGRRYGRYVDIARWLGSRAWMPIVALAEPALSAGDQPLAVAVFQAADQPGAHRSYLRQRCQELTSTSLGDEPSQLRLVR